MAFLRVKTCLILKQTINIYQQFQTFKIFISRSLPGFSAADQGPVPSPISSAAASSCHLPRTLDGWTMLNCNWRKIPRKMETSIKDGGFQQFLCPVCVECTLFLWGGLLHWVELNSFEEPVLQPRSGRMLPKSCLMSIPILIILDMSLLYQLTRSFWPGLLILPDCQRYFMYCVALGALGALRGACHALEPRVGLLTALTSLTNPIRGHSYTYHIANTRIKGQVIGKNR